MARTKEVGRVLLTCSLPLTTCIKVYEFAEKMDVGANKVIQELCAYAVKHAQCKRVSRDSIGLVFDNVDNISIDNIFNDMDEKEAE